MFEKSRIRLVAFKNRVVSYLGRPNLVHQNKPVILGDERQCLDPIFLIGCHRSGTTLARRLFNSHPNIACPPESQFLTHFVSMAKDELTYAGYDGFGYTKDEAIAQIALVAGRMHEAFMVSEGKKRWADKTPQYVDCTEGLIELFGPQSRVVAIFRHPFDVVHSIQKRKWRLLGKYDDLFEDACAYVAGCHREQLSFLAAYPDLSTTLRYEDLVADVQNEMSRVLEFLGEKWDPRILKFSDLEHNFGLEDPVIRGTKGIVPSHGAWHSWADSQVELATNYLSDTSSRLDYDLSR